MLGGPSGPPPPVGKVPRSRYTVKNSGTSARRKNTALAIPPTAPPTTASRRATMPESFDHLLSRAVGTRGLGSWSPIARSAYSDQNCEEAHASPRHGRQRSDRLKLERIACCARPESWCDPALATARSSGLGGRNLGRR